MILRLLPLLLLSVLVGALVVGIPPVGAQSVYGNVTGPDALAPRQTSTYNVTVIGGPETGAVNYSLEFFLKGADLAGGSPTEGAPERTSGSQTTFRIDITAPEKDQVVTLVVRISAASGRVTVNGSAEKSIQILSPIILRATFRNDGPIAALNVTVRFLIDDDLVGTRSIARLNASASETVSFSYLPVGLTPGAHTLRVEADIDQDGKVDSARGEVVVSGLFHREPDPLSAGWNLLIGIAVFMLVFLVTAAARRRQG